MAAGQYCTSLERSKGFHSAVLSIAALAATTSGVNAQSIEGSENAVANEQTIIVTAQRRSETLQNVPLSITALNAQGLDSAGVTNSRDLAQVTPGLRIEQTGAFVQPAIRGITTTLTSAGSEANVATYLDGIYQNLQIATLFELPDVEQIEVLKGPQGTLFGRNATGGAILIHTRKPNLYDYTGKISIGYGNLEAINGNGFVSVPLASGKAAVSIAGLASHSKGYNHDLVTGRRFGGREAQLIRAKLRFVPRDGLDFILTGSYSNMEDRNVFAYSSHKGNNTLRSVIPPAIFPDEPYEFASNLSPYSKIESRSVSLQGDIRVGPGTLSNTTAYLKYDQKSLIDGDYTTGAALFILTTGESMAFNQELVYATDQLGRFRGVFGANYFDVTSDLSPTSLNNFAPAVYSLEAKQAFGVFGEVTYDLTDSLSLTAGLRYSHEKVKARTFIAFSPAPPPDPLPLIGEASFNSVTPRVSLVYKVTPRTNLYATFSTGFKSGVFNATTAAAVEPEKVTAYEVGIKSSGIDRVSLSLAGFYYDYSDLQVSSYAPVGGGAFAVQLENAAQAEIYGVEFNATAKIAQGFNLAAGLGYLRARYKSFPAASVSVPQPGGGNMTASADVSGNVMVRSPEWTGNITASYVKPTDIGTFNLAASLYYTSKFYHEVSNRIAQRGYAMLNASLGWQPDDSDLEIRIWGKNLTDKAVISSVLLQNIGDGVAYSPPRTYGVEIRFAF